ncbi:MAG: class I SAM-dependent methyltransferase [Pseudomonadota bacterium]
MGFSSEWLDLRAPADARARDKGLVGGLAAWLEKFDPEGDGPLLVDLGAGTGATIDAVGRYAPEFTRWRLVDNDPDLLAEAARRHPTAETVRADLATADLKDLLADADIVTATAFFDLVSADWLDRLVAAMPEKAGLYTALTFDGTMRWSAEDGSPAPDDSAVAGAFIAHMTRDKGFGPALGAAAGAQLAARMAGSGRGFADARSPWLLEAPRDAALMAALADGIASAVREVNIGGLQIDPTAWRAAATGGAEIGHLDLLALRV